MAVAIRCCHVLAHENIDHIKDLLLATAGEFGNRLKGFAGAAHWPVAFGLIVGGKKVFDLYAEDRGELLQAISGQADVAAFPFDVRRLGNAQLLSDFALGEVGLLPKKLKAFSECGALRF